MKNYTFTENWFGEDGLSILDVIDTSKELHILEIGSFEGKSTIWFLDNILQNKNSSLLSSFGYVITEPCLKWSYKVASTVHFLLDIQWL